MTREIRPIRRKKQTSHTNTIISLSSPVSLSLPFSLSLFGCQLRQRTDPLSDPTPAKAPLVIGERIGLEEANLGLRRFPLLGIQLNSESTLKSQVLNPVWLKLDSLCIFLNIIYVIVLYLWAYGILM